MQSKQKMSWVQFAVHMAIWAVVTYAMMVVWRFSDDYRRILTAPEVSATVNGLAGLFWAAVVTYDCNRNGQEIARHWVIISLPLLRLLDILDKMLGQLVEWIIQIYRQRFCRH